MVRDRWFPRESGFCARHVESLCAGSRAERLQPLVQPALEFVGTHGSGDYASPLPCRQVAAIEAVQWGSAE
jgi:hypothetical protein